MKILICWVFLIFVERATATRRLKIILEYDSVVLRKTGFRAIGALRHVRLLVKVIYSLKIYQFGYEFKLTKIMQLFCSQSILKRSLCILSHINLNLKIFLQNLINQETTDPIYSKVDV